MSSLPSWSTSIAAHEVKVASGLIWCTRKAGKSAADATAVQQQRRLTATLVRRKLVTITTPFSSDGFGAGGPPALRGWFPGIMQVVQPAVFRSHNQVGHAVAVPVNQRRAGVMAGQHERIDRPLVAEYELVR